MGILTHIWQLLKTDINVLGSAEKSQIEREASEQLRSLATTLDKQNDLQEIDILEDIEPLVRNCSWLLDVLNNPLPEVVTASESILFLGTKLVRFVLSAKTRPLQYIALESVDLVVQAAFLESFQQFFKQHPELKEQLIHQPASEKSRVLFYRTIKKLTATNQRIVFDNESTKETLLCFHQSPLAELYTAALTERLSESGLSAEEAKLTAARITWSVHRYLKTIVCVHKDQLPSLAAVYGENWQHDLARYQSIDHYLEDRIRLSQVPIFDQKFCLRNIYVPPRIRPIKGRTIDTQANTSNIETWSKHMLTKQANQVLLVQGEIGRGKSVFCQMFADWIIQHWQPLFIPIVINLREITELGKNFATTIAPVIRQELVKDEGWLTDRNTRFLFFLDGIDELVLNRDNATSLADFWEQVTVFLQQCYQNPECDHRVIVTGRPETIRSISPQIPSNFAWGAIASIEKKSLKSWLKQWSSLVGAEEAQKFQEWLSDDHCPEELRTLAMEPSLFYLVAKMHQNGKIQRESIETIEESSKESVFYSSHQAKVSLLEAVVSEALETSRSDPESPRSNWQTKQLVLHSEDLRSILMEAGLWIVQSGQEQAPLSLIVERLEKCQKVHLAAKIQQIKQTKHFGINPFQNALATFHLKSRQHPDYSVEFVHRSFGDIFCAERLSVGLMDLIDAREIYQARPAAAEINFNQQIYDLLGYGHLSQDMIAHIVLLLERKEVDWSTLFDQLKTFYFVWAEGKDLEFPAGSDQLDFSQRTVEEFRQYGLQIGQREVEIYTGLNVLKLLLTIHALSQSGDNPSAIHFNPCGEPNTNDFVQDRMLRIIDSSNCLGPQTFLHQVAPYLKNAELSYVDLKNVDLRNIDLANVDFSYANLRNADFRNANLSKAGFINADLRNVDLKDANLSSADFRNVDLRNADLSNVDLSNTDLNYADLNSVNFSGANLTAASLIDTNLRNSDFTAANLKQTNFRNADLSSVNFSAAKLESANLSYADLSHADLSDISWNSETQWEKCRGLETVQNIPESLRQQFYLNIEGGSFE